jgi:26S proteasome regulatory subunit N6
MSTRGSKKDQYATTPQYDDAVDEIPIKRAESMTTLYTIMTTPAKNEAEKSQFGRMKEEAIYLLVKLYLEDKNNDKIAQIMIDIRPFFDEISKPRAAKIIRTIIDLVIQSNDSTDYKNIISLVQTAVQWATDEKRAFLRQRLQAKLAQLYMLNENYRESLLLIKKIMYEIKKIDDKPLIVDLQLLEATIYFKLRNYPKSRGALTYARATATGFYCPPITTAFIEQQAGMLSCREKDYPTAESYFHESTDNFLIVGNIEEALRSFKYGLFCKILNGQAGEVPATIQQRASDTGAASSTSIATAHHAQQQFLISSQIKAMEALSVVYQTRQYKALDKLLSKYPEELTNDTLINDQLEYLQSNLLEHSIKRIIEAYSRVDLQYIAQQLDLDLPLIEAKISSLILDEKLSAMLDHQYGDVIVIDKVKEDDLLSTAKLSLAQMNTVVEKLGQRIQKLSGKKENDVKVDQKGDDNGIVPEEADSKSTEMKD